MNSVCDFRRCGLTFSFRSSISYQSSFHFLPRHQRAGLQSPPGGPQLRPHQLDLQSLGFGEPGPYCIFNSLWQLHPPPSLETLINVTTLVKSSLGLASDLVFASWYTQGNWNMPYLYITCLFKLLVHGDCIFQGQHIGLVLFTKKTKSGLERHRKE